MHTGHDHVGEQSRKQRNRDGACNVIQPQDRGGDIGACQLTQRRQCKDRDGIGGGHCQRTDKDRLEHTGDHFVQEFFHIIRNDCQQQRRKQRTAVSFQGNIDTKHGDWIASTYNSRPFRSNQCTGHDHGICGGRAQFLGRSISDQNGHEVKHRIAHDAQQRIGRTVRKGSINLGDQQQEHLDHTAADQCRNHRLYGSGNVTNHCLPNRNLFAFQVTVQFFVHSTAIAVAQLQHLFINLQQILADDDLQLTALIGDAQHAIQIIDGFLVYLLDVLDRHAQTGHAVKYGSNIFLCSSQRHDILRQLFEIFCHCNILQKIFLDGNGQNVPVQFRTGNPIQTVQFF